MLAVLIYTAVFCLINFKHLTLLDSSGLGDFLSGLFAPIAFLYLLLGYRQQEKAINKTNQDILAQLKIQEEMLKLQLKDQKAKEHAAQPIIDFKVNVKDIPYDKVKDYTTFGPPTQSFKRRIYFNVKNSGEKISQVTFRCISPFSRPFVFNKVLETSQTLNEYLNIDEAELNIHMIDKRLDLVIQIEYRTSLGLKYKLDYVVIVSEFIPDNSQKPSLMIGCQGQSNPILID
ncbi:hypothetical protein [Acinetobacter baumannii]|uniref:hypothetical protein n=1 Tax=Acinetobacter baumannii TaxID=470 RepID=UPI001112B502|nr:hypothetical protein [Acinetobacter baumannii]MDC5679199.1 hypothetical protein [Acinetobacter baumannii]MDK2201676.1 hypothetical protein [Acinetobacter baumannii]